MNENPWSGGEGNRPPIEMKPTKPQKNKLKAYVPTIFILVALLILAFDSVYMLNSGQEAVITRFGSYKSTVTQTGLQFKLPIVEARHIVNVAEIRRLEFGFRSTSPGAATYTVVSNEASMLTGDENLVLADWAIMYQVRNSYNWLFKVNEPENVLRIIAESAYRRVVASHPLEAILTDQKDAIQNEVMIDLQQIINKYELGAVITGVELQDAQPPDQVRAAFLDVSAAREDKSAIINEASKYENQRMPIARGEAEKLINDAEAYKARRINEAQGTVARYIAIEAEYRIRPDIVHTRMYLEMLRDVLPRVRNIYIVDDNSNTLQFLPLNEMGVGR
jgi:membrane protease subunit HflK